MQLFLNLFTLGNILEDNYCAIKLARRGMGWAGRVFNRQHFIVMGTKHTHVCVECPAFRTGFIEFGVKPPGFLCMMGGYNDRLVQVLADQRRAVYTQDHFGGGIHKGDGSLQAHTDDAFPHRTQQHFVTGFNLFEFTERIFQLPLPAIQLQKNPDLTEQNKGIEGLEHKVHASALIAFEHIAFFFVDGGQKDNGNVTGLGPLAHIAGHFKAIHSGHLHVQQHHGDGLLEQNGKRFRAGRCGNDFHIIKIRQSGFQCHQICLLIIHYEYALLHA